MINFMPQRETFRDLSWYIAFINIFHGVLHSLIPFTVHYIHYVFRGHCIHYIQGKGF